MSSHRSCKSCRDRQEDLLESGDGSQVVCLCYDELSDEEIQQLEKSSHTAQVRVNEELVNDEFVAIN